MTQYDATTQAVRQANPWACSVCSTTFLLNAIGNPISSAEMQDLMVPRLVTPEQGLLYGNGSGLAAFLRDQFSLDATAGWVAWPWLQRNAGTMPIIMGGVGWNHWVAVRRVDENGNLSLANPAPGWMGVGDTLTEADFDRLGAFAAVWVRLPSVPEEDTLSAEERTELDTLRDLKTYTDALTQTILPSALGTMEAAAKGSKSKLADVVRGQCAAVREQAGL